MTDMSADLSRDVIDLQIKVAYLENTIDTLNDVIATQDRALKDLQDQLKFIYRFLENQHDAPAPFDLLNDRPPHY